MANFQIFISYRRDGGEDLAGRISDKFKGLGYNVFYDIESMRSGTFNTQILTAIEQCQDVLLILPPNGLDRCRDEEDWVRQEIEHAIKLGKNIIPIMMRGFTFPDVLPPSIDGIRYYEGVQASTIYFDASVQRIESLLKSTRGPQSATSDDLTKGIRFINNKQYPLALSCLEKAMESDLSNPDVYFYTAIARLGGKRPFLIPKNVINTVLEHLNTAVAIEERPVYRYLLAYVKFDYHHRKMIRTQPDFMEELTMARALGLTEGESDSLFELLHVDKPDLF